MNVAVVFMRMMKMSVDHIVNVIAVRNLFVSAFFTVAVIRRMLGLRTAHCRIFRNVERMFVDVIAVRAVQMAVMDVVDVPVVFER